jgi:uncharacterized protein YfaS (alpha-2-macroglobulin family)
MYKPVLRYLILALLSCAIFTHPAKSQQPARNYDNEWKNVDALVDKDLTKSALAAVKKIHSKAKADKQDVQVIKALIYEMQLQEQTRENNLDSSILELQKELTAGQEPSISIINSLLAGAYESYYENNRWSIYNRTATVNFKKDDIATWGAEDFHRVIADHYLKSIRNEKLLQQTRLEGFDAILIKGNMRHLRPTLFDLLTHRALEYFENDERDLKRPAYAFEIDQAAAFDPAADFVTRKFTTKDSSSLQHKALLLFQRILSFHLKDSKPDAFIDADLLRLDFVYRHATHPDKENLYLNALNHIARQYPNLPAATQASFMMADWYTTQGKTFKPYGDSTHRLDLVKAKQICETIVAQKDSSEGKINCYNLLNRLTNPALHFQLERVNLPNQPFRVLVNYSNITQLFCRLIRVDENNKLALRDYLDDKLWQKLTTANAFREWQQPLPDLEDLQEHNVEIKVESLPPGEYMLLASTDKLFSTKKGYMGVQRFAVSSISYVNQADQLFVLDRDNGQPLPGASVQVWTERYDPKSSKYVKEKVKLYKTDTNGYCKIDKRSEQDRYNNLYFDITYKSERLFLDEPVRYYYYDYESTGREKIFNKDQHTTTFLFTDRSLYRPGQTAYFKGIAVLKDENEQPSIRASWNNEVYLVDANYQKIDSLPVQTNEFGSFSGRFALPAQGLTGNFTLQLQLGSGQQNFRVEEYKRPKYYVDYEKLKGTYRVNDRIRITGIAKAYAGNNIDGAAVSYRVVREPRFLYSWLFTKWWQPPSESMEIAHGEIKTNKDGKFEIEFTAIPDLKIDRKFDPVFDYTIYADVTDINGETRSGSKTVTVGYKSLLLKVDLADKIPVDSLRYLDVRTENTNGEAEPALVQVVINPLKPESRLIRERYWARPDQFVMSREDYIRNFPNDEYSNESSRQSWEKAGAIATLTDSVKENSRIDLKGLKLQPGNYVLEFSTRDKNGEEVREVKYLEVYDENNGKLNFPAYLWVTRAGRVSPGETALSRLGSTAGNLFVIQQVSKERSAYPDISKNSNFSFFRLDNEIKPIAIPISEADRGGFGLNFLFVRNNRFYQSNQSVFVPWDNKDLKIEYATYRDKTLPGSQEKWKVKLSGYKNELVAAEMLASMYDASLDQFYPHAWSLPYIWPFHYGTGEWNGSQSFSTITAINNLVSQPGKQLLKYYDRIFNDPQELKFQYDLNPDVRSRNAPVFYTVATTRNIGGYMGLKGRSAGVVLRGLSSVQSDSNKESMFAFTTKNGDGLPDQLDKSPGQDVQQGNETQVRKNFNETAFFLPDLRTDSAGAIEFSFTMPEALTKWKFQALAHTRDLAFGYSTRDLITQKQLMVQPNPPRFLREGDRMEFSAKIVNLTDKEITGQAEFQLFDTRTNQAADGRFKNVIPNQYFTIAAGQSEAVKFPIEVPYQYNQALTWRIVAHADDMSDGEEDALPVLTNRMLVTETMPLNLRGTTSKDFKFEKLLNSGNSESLQNQSLTVEFTSNPAWLAVQSLPYLMEYPYECAEQTWNRYYANSLAMMVANSSPKIKAVFDQWKTKDTSALLSNLQKNQELKALLLEETPWVLAAKTEAEQKKNIALLFDLITMSGQLNGAYEKLKQMQTSNGGFVWFKGGPDDSYITQYILTGIGHLRKLKAVSQGQEAKLKTLLDRAISYLDLKIRDEYNSLARSKTDLKKYVPGSFQVQYLYMRSFFPDYKVPPAVQAAYNYFRSRAQSTWAKQGKYFQGMIALALFRTGDAATPKLILQSLKETSINNDELGMYWKDASRGWWWYEAPIERQALIIEAFAEAGKDTKTVDDLKTWLLKNKQANSWESTKSTAEACYALLLQGSQWTSEEPAVTIQVGNQRFSSQDAQQSVEAGTGYFKTIIDGEKVRPQMGNINVRFEKSPAPGTSSNSGWGAVYWQYFEDLDKITTAETPLKLVKKLFVEKNTDRGPVLTPVNDGDALKVGDKIKVRIELRVDRDMEYVHMKDMRASSMEPVNVLSGYNWQDGLGYYQSTRDASTNFFFDNLRKGTYVFEYPLFVTHAGNFSNGVATIQCMYAPEFSAHSEGIRINVE